MTLGVGTYYLQNFNVQNLMQIFILYGWRAQNICVGRYFCFGIFSLSNMHQSTWKLMKIFILIHRREKKLKFYEIIVHVYDVNFFGYVFGLKVFFVSKIMILKGHYYNSWFFLLGFKFLKNQNDRCEKTTFSIWTNWMWLGSQLDLVVLTKRMTNYLTSRQWTIWLGRIYI